MIKLANLRDNNGLPIEYLTGWQIEEIAKTLAYGETLWNWGRGFSKTLLCTVLSVFAGIHGLKVLYLVPSKKQLDQPKAYFEQFPYIDKKGRDKKESDGWYYINGEPRIHIDILGDNAIRSGRFHVVILDECGQLVSFPKREQFMQVVDGVQRAMSPTIKLLASTPTIGSQFEKTDYYLQEKWANQLRRSKQVDASTRDIIQQYGSKYTSHRNFLNTTPNFVANTPDKYALLLEQRARYKSLGLEWLWNQENLAMYQVSGGAAFNNLQVTQFNHLFKDDITHFGYDFHGPETGHIEVGIHYRPEYPWKFYILHEEQHTYLKTASAEDSVKFIDHPAYYNKSKRVESYGFNYGYWMAAQQFGVQPVNIGGQAKHNLAWNLLQYHIYIDPKRTPKVYEDLRTAIWQDQNKFQVYKEDSGETYRNHYLDALMNGVPLWGYANYQAPSKSLTSNEILKRELEREKRFQYINQL